MLVPGLDGGCGSARCCPTRAVSDIRQTRFFPLSIVGDMLPVARTLLAAFLALLACAPAFADKKTVCTITVNSDDEKETLRARLPKDKFRFVELVEHGRSDWLASSCHKGIQCDVLVISGHFAGTNFFSEEIETQEFLPVEEMERVSCSDSCPGLFSKLKEVYLFGCNTLNGETFESQTAEVARSLMRDGTSKSDAERQSRALNGRYGETNRDRMRRIFANVPVIYGFSSKAPLGPAAAGSLGRYLQQAPARARSAAVTSAAACSATSAARR